MNTEANLEWWKRAYGAQTAFYSDPTLNFTNGAVYHPFTFGPTSGSADEAPDEYVDTGFGIMQSSNQELKILPDRYQQKLPQANWAAPFLAANQNSPNGVWK